jgi:hypothetical protein
MPLPNASRFDIISFGFVQSACFVNILRDDASLSAAPSTRPIRQKSKSRLQEMVFYVCVINIYAGAGGETILGSLGITPRQTLAKLLRGCLAVSDSWTLVQALLHHA